MASETPTAAYDSEDEQATRVAKLVARVSLCSDDVSDGKKKSLLFDGAKEAHDQKEIDTELSDLKHVVDEADFPWLRAGMKPMQCIPFNPDSPFVRKNPGSKPRDVWWSHLEVDYETQGGNTVTSKTVVVSPCYLDLVSRTSGKLQQSYGKDVVNVYIPTATCKEIYATMLNACNFDNFAEGKEIVDHAQGLTSFLCQNGNENDLGVVMYTPEEMVDQDGNPVGVHYARNGVQLPELYAGAAAKPKYRILGGAAFLRFGLSHLCDPDAHVSNQPLPSSVLPDVKIKILGFHTLQAAGDKVKQITYASKATKTY